MAFSDYFATTAFFEAHPRCFETWLFYKPKSTQLSTTLNQSFSAENVIPLNLSPAFTLMTLKQIDILRALHGYGHLAVTTTPRKQRKQIGHRLRMQIQAGTSHQFYIRSKEQACIDEWHRQVAISMLTECHRNRQPTRHDLSKLIAEVRQKPEVPQKPSDV